MAKNSSTQGVLLQFLSTSLVILYLCIGFVPNWGAVDKIAPQWLGLSVLNAVSLVFFLGYRNYFKTALRHTLSSKISLLYIAFFLWAAASYFYAINPTEVLVNLPRHLNTLLMYLFMGTFIGGISKRAPFFSWVIIIILGIEVYAVLTEALAMIESTGVIASGALKGVTANRNITAFSIAIKVPFTLFLLVKVKVAWRKGLLGILITLALLCLTIIQSRAAFVASGATLLFFSALCLYFYTTTKEKKMAVAPRIIFIPFIRCFRH